MLIFDSGPTLKSNSHKWSRASLLVAAMLAAGTSTLFAYTPPPSTSLLNSVLAIVGWGIFVVALGVAIKCCAFYANRGLVGLLTALSILAMASLVAPLWMGQPFSLAISNAGALAMAAALVIAGAVASGSGGLQSVFSSVAWAWVVAGLLSFMVGTVQVFAPDVADGYWIAQTGSVGRAVGNLRQPNHVSTLFLWTSVSAIWLQQSGSLKRRVAALFHVLMIAGVVMSGSRTGLMGVMLLLLWGLGDKGKYRFARLTLISSPLVYVGVWLSLATWAHYSQHVFGAEARLMKEGALASSRYDLWANTLELIRQHPLTGVGFGGFNFAWSLTPFADRSNEFFDHSHNIELQFIVELGFPIALVVLALLVYALRRAFVTSFQTSGSDGIALRAALLMLLLIVLHSQLEYPLWYPYFLLPTAMLFGLILGYREPVDNEKLPSTSPAGSTNFQTKRALVLVGSLIAVAGAAVMLDYARITAIFSPSAHATSLAERIRRGQNSTFLSYQADYAAVTTVNHPSEVMENFKGPVHNVLDPRLLIAWAVAFVERGDLERGRNLAARLREFDSRQADDFFKQCDIQNGSDARSVSLPFQCDPPKTNMKPEDFR